MINYYSLSDVADMLSVSKKTLRRWDKSGKLPSVRHPLNGYRIYPKAPLQKTAGLLFDNTIEQVAPKPTHPFSAIELFAGAGGLALGLEKAGINCVLLNEIDKHACETLRQNRPNWHIVEKDIRDVDFTFYHKKIDIVCGGFPCQTFSYAGKKLGFEDTRGTLFYEFARVIKETQPLIALGENVRGLLTHDNGRTLQTMISVLEKLGYQVLPPHIIKAIYHKVPQKRERLLIVALRKDAELIFDFPKPHQALYTLKDALKKGSLFDADVPQSIGQSYPPRKKEILEQVPPGGYWRDLPLELQKEYMQKSFYLGGGKTGMARRISWDEACLTLTCSPAQKQTERCHPDQTRPFTIREYARIQTFPDEWTFTGSMSSQYQQIGNAVPVNLAEAIGLSIVRSLNDFYARHKEKTMVADLINQ